MTTVSPQTQECVFRYIMLIDVTAKLDGALDMTLKKTNCFLKLITCGHNLSFCAFKLAFIVHMLASCVHKVAF